MSFVSFLICLLRTRRNDANVCSKVQVRASTNDPQVERVFFLIYVNKEDNPQQITEKNVHLTHRNTFEHAFKRSLMLIFFECFQFYDTHMFGCQLSILEQKKSNIERYGDEGESIQSSPVKY